MRFSLTFLALLFTFTSISQSAWTQKKGEAYAQLSFTTISKYNELFGLPDYFTERTINDQTLQLYAEYGINDKTTIIVNIPFKHITSSGLTDDSNLMPFTIASSESVLGNIELGVKQNLYNKRFIISAQLNIEANTSYFNIDSGIRSGYNAWTLTPTLNVAKNFNKFYVQGFTGFNIRTNNYSSNFKVGGEIGTKPLNKLWLIANIDIVESFQNSDANLPFENLLTGLYVNNQEYASYGLKGIFEFSQKFGATGSFGGAFSGNNVAKQVALNFGIYHKF